MTFNDLGLMPELISAVVKKGYVTPTPIQASAIPAILSGRDVLGGAQTGTGKTAAFTLPMLQILSGNRRKDKRPRALVLTPTRELAAQVEESVQTYGAHLDLRSVSIFGGVGIAPQTARLKGGVDILVATPGRLLDHARQKNVDLSALEIFILDEADRMLDMGFINDIRKVIALLPKKRQNLLFSATYTDPIKKLADSILHDPAMVEVPRQDSVADLVEQVIHPVEKSRKRDLLSHLISENDWKQVLVFTNTKHGANRLAQQLNKDGLNAQPIHGNKSQGARTAALKGFKEGTIRVLIATEVAARGLDIKDLPHVVNYDLPHVPEDYVHRIGRTGRAGSEGRALSLVGEEDMKQLAAIERLLKTKIPREIISGFKKLSNPPAPERYIDPRSRNRKPALEGKKGSEKEGYRHQTKKSTARLDTENTAKPQSKGAKPDSRKNQTGYKFRDRVEGEKPVHKSWFSRKKP